MHETTTYLRMKSYYPVVPKLHASEPGLYFVCLCIYTRIYNIHVHAVVGSDKKLGMYEGKLLSNSHTNERLIVKD